MQRRVFFSFHFANDFWRTQQVRNIRALEGQRLATPNSWEAIKRRGDLAIKKWIDDSMRGKSCVIVLVGSHTASRRWVRYEISKGWNDGKGILGIRVHGLLNEHRLSSFPGDNPFTSVKLPGSTRTLAQAARLKSPSGNDSRAIYGSIANNIDTWIEEAISIRQRLM